MLVPAYVTVSDTTNPVFPDRCIRCGTVNPTSASPLLLELFCSDRFQVERRKPIADPTSDNRSRIVRIPCCDRFNTRIHRKWLLRAFGLGVMFALATIAA